MTDARSTTVAPGDLGLVAELGRHPGGRETEDGLAGRDAGERAGVVAEHEHVAGRGFAAPDVDAVHAHRVRARRELEVVAGAHERDDDAELERELAPQRAHAVEEVAALGRVDEVDEVVRDLELERLDAHLADEVLGRVGRQRDRRDLDLLGRGLRALGDLGVAGQPGREQQERAADDEERDLGQAGDDRDRADRAAAELQRLLVPRELVQQVGTEVHLGRGPGHDEAGRERDQQRRDLGDQAVADGEQAVGLDRLAERQVLLQDADREPADEVDRDDDDRRDRVALHELRGTVHRTVEVGFFGDLPPPALRLVVVDEPGVQVGVDRHLLAGHRVEGEARGDLGDAPGTVRDHDELDHDEDQEDDEADDHRPADDEVAERLDDLARVAVQQHEPGDRHVEREAEQRRDEEVRREDREVEDAA